VRWRTMLTAVEASRQRSSHGRVSMLYRRIEGGAAILNSSFRFVLLAYIYVCMYKCLYKTDDANDRFRRIRAECKDILKKCMHFFRLILMWLMYGLVNAANIVTCSHIIHTHAHRNTTEDFCF
jgi:hypothetical protein